MIFFLFFFFFLDLSHYSNVIKYRCMCTTTVGTRYKFVVTDYFETENKCPSILSPCCPCCVADCCLCSCPLRSKSYTNDILVSYDKMTIFSVIFSQTIFLFLDSILTVTPPLNSLSLSQRLIW